MKKGVSNKLTEKQSLQISKLARCSMTKST